jgi:hypothetical protein
MTTTPKGVILLVVGVLGLFAVAALAGCFVLLLEDKPSTAVVVLATPMGVALGAVAGVLASTRTTPELAPGVTVTGSSITNSGDPAAAPAPLVGTLVQNTMPTPPAASSTTAPMGSQTLEPIDPATIPGYALPVPPAPAATEPHQTDPIVSADYSSTPATTPDAPPEPQQ